MATIGRAAEDVAWLCLAIGAMAAAPFVFVYGFVAITLYGSFPLVALLPFDSMPRTLVIGLTMVWILLSLAASFGLACALLFGVAKLILRFRTKPPELHGPRRPPVRR